MRKRNPDDIVYIYGLVDPRTDEVRYIGQSSNPRGRVSTGVWHARQGHEKPLYRWILSLLECDLQPVIVILEETTGLQCNNAEQRSISEYRARGADLLNLSDGGPGSTGYHPTPDQLQRQSAGQRGIPKTQHFIELVRERMMGNRFGVGRIVSESERAAISARMTGRIVSDETRAKIGAASRARSPESNAKIAAAKRGKPLSDEHRAKLRAAHARRREAMRQVEQMDQEGAHE